MEKTWKTPLHKRKVWKQMSLSSKIVYFMKPFMDHFIDVWMQPLPFPTILKCAYSSVLLVFLMFPFLYPCLILIFYYAIVQYFVESCGEVQFPKNFDVVHNVVNSFTTIVPPEACDYFTKTYLEKFRYIAAACASCIDYLRLGTSLVFG